eukprot:TRINITY_DN38488_c0_g1_i1.p1 TRINITY_DN38488_c0_g1~~TRINITY_DN38488_c0_g1_i1.p1  ORF type:complete len:247 (+),score=123.66 TRINITY_DN38488_c0_g1_i1:3-743(+)
MMGKPAAKPPAKAAKGGADVEKLKGKLKDAEAQNKMLEEKLREKEAAEGEFDKMMEDAKEVIMVREGVIAELEAKVKGLEEKAAAQTEREVGKVIQMGRSSIASITAQAEAKIREVEKEKEDMKTRLENTIAELQMKLAAAQAAPQPTPQPDPTEKASASTMKKLQMENEELVERLAHFQERFQKAIVEKQAAITEKENLQDTFEERIQKEKRLIRKQYRQENGLQDNERTREVVAGRERDMPVVP